jgi:outer membrane lipoprotein-sorting protein
MRIAALLMALLLMAASARAEDAASSATSYKGAEAATSNKGAEAAPAEIGAIQAYLNCITTLKARFVQTDNDGQKTQGEFYLSRPGRMRFQYDAPVTDFVVADGLFVYYYDGQMKQVSNTPIGLSLANFFLRKTLVLSGDLSVTDVKKAGGMLQLTLVQTRHPVQGSLTLFYSQNPMQLKKWRVVDESGAVTEVDLSGVEEGITLDPDLFKYRDPERKKVKYN